jgi:hypothetical protein
MRSLILLIKFEFVLQFWTQPTPRSAVPTGGNRGADRFGHDRGLTCEGAVDGVERFAKPIIFRFQRIRRWALKPTAVGFATAQPSYNRVSRNARAQIAEFHFRE